MVEKLEGGQSGEWGGQAFRRAGVKTGNNLRMARALPADATANLPIRGWFPTIS